MTHDEFEDFCRSVPPQHSNDARERLPQCVAVDMSNHVAHGEPCEVEALRSRWRVTLTREVLRDLGFDEPRVLAFTKDLN